MKSVKKKNRPTKFFLFCPYYFLALLYFVTVNIRKIIVPLDNNIMQNNTDILY